MAMLGDLFAVNHSAAGSSSLSVALGIASGSLLRTRRSQVRVLQGAPLFSTTYSLTRSGPVNNREQFAADFLDGVANGPIEYLRVHVQRRVDVGVPHQLRHHLPRHSLVVRPRRIGPPEGQPRRARQPSCSHAGKMDRRRTLFGEMAVPQSRGEHQRLWPVLSMWAFHSAISRSAETESGICRDPASVFGVLNVPS